MSNKCIHFYELIGKTIDSGYVYYEFYCKNCLDIQLICESLERIAKVEERARHHYDKVKRNKEG